MLQLKWQVAGAGSSCWSAGLACRGSHPGAALCSQGASGKLLKISAVHGLLQASIVQTHRKHSEQASTGEHSVNVS